MESQTTINLACGVAALFSTLLIFQPKIDRNLETGDYLLWYNTTDSREYIIIWKSFKKDDYDSTSLT